jgi:N-acetylmuramoyl-L-alanine amidase
MTGNPDERMITRLRLSSFLLWQLVLALALTARPVAAELLTPDGKSHYLPSIWIEQIEYVSVNDLSSALGAEVFWHRMLRKVTLEFEDHQMTFVWFSPYVLYDSRVYNLAYDAKLQDGTLWIPVKGFQRIWDLIHAPPVPTEAVVPYGQTARILDLKVEEKVNGILVEVLISRPLEYEVLPDQNGDVNIVFYKGKVDTSYFNRKRVPAFVSWVKAYQFEGSAQVSLRLKKPFSSLTQTLKADPYRIQISLLQTPFPGDTGAVLPMHGRDEGPQEKQDLIDVIVIDPGHGGADSGAVGSRGLVEKDVTLDIAQRLNRLLEKEPGLKIILTRRDDVLVPLEERTAIANRSAADLFVSIHTNASPKRSAHGSQTFFLSAAKTDEARAAAALENSSIRFEPPGSESVVSDDVEYILMDLVQSEYQRESQDLAGMIESRLKDELPITSRGVGQAGFVVLNKAYMPAVLVETAFISNREEEDLLKKGSFRQKVAQALYESIKQFKGKYEVEN